MHAAGETAAAQSQMPSSRALSKPRRAVELLQQSLLLCRAQVPALPLQPRFPSAVVPVLEEPAEVVPILQHMTAVIGGQAILPKCLQCSQCEDVHVRPVHMTDGAQSLDKPPALILLIGRGICDMRDHVGLMDTLQLACRSGRAPHR